MSLLLLFQGTPTSDVTVALTGQAVTASAGTLLAANSVPLAGQSATASAGTVTGLASYTAALSGQAATASAGTLLAATSRALSGQAVTASAGTILPASSVALSGQAVTASAGTLLPASSIALSGQAAAASAGTLLPELSVGLNGAEVTAAAGTVGAESTSAEPLTVVVGGDDARRHPGWNKKRATLKRDRDREFTEQIRDIYRTLIGDPRTAERAEQIVASVTEPVKVKGESEAAHEAALMARADALRKRADAMDAEALQAEIALRLLHQELRELQEAEDMDVLDMLLPMMLGTRSQPVEEARQQIARELWDDKYDAEAIEILLAHVL